MNAPTSKISDLGFRSLRIDIDPCQHSFWCTMHPGDASPRRPCFSTPLLNELRGAQRRVRALSSAQPGLWHFVWASEAPVYNLGGDLALFLELIRRRDRAALLDYASLCIEVAHGFHRGLDCGIHTIALIQGDALGGGFEAALCAQTVIIEEQARMGFPEVLFGLFPGMGAYSLLRSRMSASQAERMILDGRLYSAQELLALGLVDRVVATGEGTQAARDCIQQHRRIAGARGAVDQLRRLYDGVSQDELMRITTVWVDTALSLDERSLRVMDRLLQAQRRRFEAVGAASGQVEPVADRA